MKNLVLIAFLFISGSSLQAQGTDSAALYFDKGQAEQKARRFREAEKNYAEASRLAPDNNQYKLSLADVLLEQRRYNEAITQYEAVGQAEPNNAVVAEKLAQLLQNMHQWEKSIQYAQQLEKLDPSKDMSFIVANNYYKMERYADAIKYCELAYKRDPKRAEVPYIAGRCFMEMHNYRKAAGCYDQALALDSSNAKWMYEAALVWYSVPDDKKSLYWMKKAGEKGYPQTNDYLENLATAYLNTGDYKEGIGMLKKVLERRPQDPELLFSIADACYKSKQYQDAIDYWDQVLGIDKKNANALYMIGMSYQKKGDKEKGMQLCDKAIEMDPSLKSLKQERKMPGGM